MDLMECRKRIDEIDSEMVRLLEDRMEISRAVAEYKLSVGKKIYDRQRELEKLAVFDEMASNEFNQKALREIFSQIMSISRKLQYTLLKEDHAAQQFRPVDSLNIKPETRIAFFGVRGSYTEQAMEELFGDGCQSFSISSFKGIMEAVQNGEAEFGILPIENSSTGGIDDIYDLLVEYDNIIVGQHIIKIDQALIGCPGAEISDIRRVYSHEQGLLQCARFLEAHPRIQAESADSTAGAARKVKEDGDRTQAAIASVRAAKVYGLQVLQECINYESTNSTRFIVIARERIYKRDADLISLCLSLPHEKGSLYGILSHIIYNNLNMTKIESRPLHGKPFEYRFFIDFEGNLESPGVRNALRGMEAEAEDFRILGNYKNT